MHVDRAVYKSLREKYGDEQVYVVPYQSMKNVPDKFTPCNDIASLSEYDKIGRYILRYDAEENVSFQQLIPHIMIKNQQGKYLVADRISGDERLTGQKTLGFGGHIDPVDGHVSVILNGMMRELYEEVDIKPISPTYIYKGTMRDLSSSTSDHTGFIFEITVKSAKIKETHKLKGQWMTVEQLVDHYFQFESWGKMYIDYLYENR